MASAPDRIAVMVGLDRLDLDASNPRFGDAHGRLPDQAAILDYIVENYGIDDVLSSLAVNGYFRAEPLVGRMIEGTDRYTIVEGNRRLAACLILTGDERARGQAQRSGQIRQLWEQHGKKQIDPVPVISFTGEEPPEELLSYLGVRHISSAQPWDSYAKATWVARVISTTSLSVVAVSTMIGDQHRTVSRLLDGYYFINQAVRTGVFVPENSVRSGRGSVTEYPFSWVYTILGYTAARQYLSLVDSGPQANPVPDVALPNARIMLDAMFGNKAKGRNSAIQDSRALGDLAAALLVPEKVDLLEQGKSLSEINRLTKPIGDRLRENLAMVRTLQAEVLAGLSENIINEAVASAHVGAAQINRRSATDIARRLEEAISPGGEDG